MMKKFNDIFSIDSSTGGGKRLIKNIINKYRLGNEYKEIKENIENKGNSEGGSNATYKYYYRIDNKLDETLAYMAMYYYMYKLHNFRTADTNEYVGIEEQIIPLSNAYTSNIIKVRMDKFPTFGTSSEGKGAIINLESMCNATNLPYPIDITELLSLEVGSEKVLESIRVATEEEIKEFENNITIRNNLN